MMNLCTQQHAGHRVGPGPRAAYPVTPTLLSASHTRKPQHTCLSALPELAAAVLDGHVQLASHLPVAAVGLPCNVAACGDLYHQSTLDRALRGEVLGPDWRTWALLAAAGWYLLAPPGVLPGAIDFYILARLRSATYGKDDITVGKKLATGGFGTVYKGELRTVDGETLPVIIKKAKEFGQAEAYMNERMMRLPGSHAAEFITAFADIPALGAKQKRGSEGEDGAVWLVWRYEGDNTLWNLMQAKSFPYNMEPLLFDRELRSPPGLQRKAVSIRLVFKQLVQALAAAHSTGIVHRDVKPQNCILSDRDKKLKLIDLGAAADLRVGINYQPAEYLLDPRYAPPQMYVMSTQTPTPPPAPVAAFLSPILWRMENPDRFDMYSCGITLLQLAFPALRSDNAIEAFNKRLQALKWDLGAWRAEEEGRRGGPKPELAEGFQLLDLDGGAGWELLCRLLAFKPQDRITAAEALLSPFFKGSSVTAPLAPEVAMAGLSQQLLDQAGKALSRSFDSEMLDGFASSATGADRGSLTEAQLRQELGLDQASPVAPRARTTIAWFQERQVELNRKLEKREGSGGSSGLPMRGSSRARSSSPPVGAPVKGVAGARPPSSASPANSNTSGNSRAQTTPSPPGSTLFTGVQGLLSRAGLSGASFSDSSLDADTDSEPDEPQRVPAGSRAFNLRGLLGRSKASSK